MLPLEWCWEKTSECLGVVFPLYVPWRERLSECRRLALIVDKYVCDTPKKKIPKEGTASCAVTCNCVILFCVIVLDPHSHWCCGHIPSWACLLLPGIWGGALGLAGGS